MWPYTDLPTQHGQCSEADLDARLDAHFADPRRSRVVEAIYDTASRNRTRPACTADACAQGRKACPSPQACLRPERYIPARGDGIERGAFLVPLAVLAAVALFGLLVTWGTQ